MRILGGALARLLEWDPERQHKVGDPMGVRSQGTDQHLNLGEAEKYGPSHFTFVNGDVYWAKSDLMRSRSTGKSSCSNHGLR